MGHELVPDRFLPPSRVGHIYFDREELRQKAEQERLLNHLNMSVHPSVVLTLLDGHKGQ